MENNTPKQLPYQDDFEFNRNMARIMIIVLYTPTMILMMHAGLEDGREYLNSFGDWPTFHYLVFFAPMAVSVLNLQMVKLEKKSKVPMPRVSKHFIYGSWVVSAAFYSLIILVLLS